MKRLDVSASRVRPRLAKGHKDCNKKSEMFGIKAKSKTTAGQITSTELPQSEQKHL